MIGKAYANRLPVKQRPEGDFYPTLKNRIKNEILEEKKYVCPKCSSASDQIYRHSRVVGMPFKRIDQVLCNKCGETYETY